ncbi:uncharacterized protein LOC129911842 [Episyrphus balteatus]|uniref:uncharacterized protein LOC129911842 n=1 Tax=Episyrphus balteatus TaxID=286459 RepID=UPI002484FDC9|nr:uncharacterized protein LOC129911842 [Episyrphus balteatus]
MVLMQNPYLSLHDLEIANYQIEDAWKIDTPLGEKFILQLTDKARVLFPFNNKYVTEDNFKELPGYWMSVTGNDLIFRKTIKEIQEIFGAYDDDENEDISLVFRA